MVKTRKVKTRFVTRGIPPKAEGIGLTIGPTGVTQCPVWRLDLGCGPNKKKTDAAGNLQEWTGVDSIAFPGVDVVCDLRQKWPWADNSIEEAHCSHCLEHFDANERVHFLNELWRVLKVGAKCSLIVPYWASGRAYGDPTHKWPPISDFATYYWRKEWRMSQAPHTDISNNPNGFSCNFEVVGGFTLHPEIALRSQEYQQHAMTFFKEACQDMVSTLTKLA